MSAASAGRLLGEGLMSGVPDLFLDVPRNGKHGLRIEMKVPARPATAKHPRSRRAGVVDPDQKKWIAYYQEAGYAAFVAYGWREAVDIIKEYLAVR
ncbi:VRR-NUC domain protein [compost metagenome]